MKTTIIRLGGKLEKPEYIYNGYTAQVKLTQEIITSANPYFKIYNFSKIIGSYVMISVYNGTITYGSCTFVETRVIDDDTINIYRGVSPLGEEVIEANIRVSIDTTRVDVVPVGFNLNDLYLGLFSGAYAIDWCDFNFRQVYFNKYDNDIILSFQSAVDNCILEEMVEHIPSGLTSIKIPNSGTVVGNIEVLAQYADTIEEIFLSRNINVYGNAAVVLDAMKAAGRKNIDEFSFGFNGTSATLNGVKMAKVAKFSFDENGNWSLKP